MPLHATRPLALLVAGLLVTACGPDSPEIVDDPTAPITDGAEESATPDDTATGPVGSDVAPGTQDEPAPAPSEETGAEDGPADDPTPTEADDSGSSDSGSSDSGDDQAEAPPAEPAREPVAYAADVFDFGYEPAQLSIAVGDSVTWTNVGDVNHTVTFSGGPDSGSMSTDDTFGRTFDAAGTFNYRCLFHSQMQGTVTVG